MTYKRFAFLLLGLVLSCASVSLMAQTSVNSAEVPLQISDWPSKPLRWIVPYPPGGPLDSMARLLAEKAKGSIGQTIIVENKPGAGGNIGADVVAKAAPDGYTLVMGAVATHAINPWLFARIPYDSVRDFAPVALVASVPNVLVLNKEFANTNSIRTLQDLLAYARLHPGELNYGSGGSGSAGHLAGALLNARAQLNVVHIPYQGAAPAQLALLSGQSHFMFDNLAAAAGLIKDAKVIPLAVTTTMRAQMLPDVPTMQEAGVQPFDIGTWFGIFTTAGTPPAVVSVLHKAFQTALTDPAVLERLQAMGSEAAPLTVAQFAEMVQTEREKYREIVRISGAQAN